MENLSASCQDEDQMDMPPGFRFHPTDEELITHYLLNKVLNHSFVCKTIGEVDMNKIEPWDLPGVAKMGETEWYFFCIRDRKYPAGSRTNRATAIGYWKATGKDKEIFTGRALIGMKKTLVFYMGRAPKGEKTNWVLHEYRLEGKFSQHNLPKSAKTEWVICRVFHKNSGEKKVPISGGVATSLPPLAALGGGIINPRLTESNHVHCFSNSIENQTTQNNMISTLLNNQDFPFEPNSISDYPLTVYNHTILSGLIGSYGTELKMETEIVTGSEDTGVSSESNFEKGKRGVEDEEAPSNSVDLDCIWNY